MVASEFAIASIRLGWVLPSPTGPPLHDWMASPSDAHSATSGGGAAAAKQDLRDIFNQLDLNDDDFDDVEIDEEDPEIDESVRWLALARVHTEKKFSQSAFYKDMRAAWNPAQRVRFRPVGPNLFVVQASFLGDWERMMRQGPWLFRNWAVLMCPYDGFSKTEEIDIGDLATDPQVARWILQAIDSGKTSKRFWRNSGHAA